MSGGNFTVSSLPYRNRRMFRKICYAILLIIAVLVWQSAIPVSKSKRALLGRELEEQELDHKPRPVNIAVGDVELFLHGHQYPYSQLFAIATPTLHTLATSPVDPAYLVVSTSKLMSQNDNNDQTINSIDTDIYAADGKLASDVKLLHSVDDAQSVHRIAHQVSTRQSQVPLTEFSQKRRLNGPGHPPEEMIGGVGKDEMDVEGSVSQSIYTQKSIEDSHAGSPGSEHYQFPTQEECESIKQKAELMPDFTHVPFEESVQNIILEGWEDEWIAKARYSGPHLDEPEIDFVYNCELLFRALHHLADMFRRGQWLAARVHPDHASIRTQLYTQRSRQHMDFIAQIQ
jgi:hypothetical protein